METGIDRRGVTQGEGVRKIPGEGGVTLGLEGQQMTGRQRRVAKASLSYLNDKCLISNPGECI